MKPSQPSLYSHIYIHEATADHALSVLVRLAINVVFAFLSDTLALNTLFDLGDQAVHVLLVSANKGDCISRLAPSRVAVHID